MRDQGELVRLLLEHGADPTLRDRAGRTARDWALAKGHADLAAQLPATDDEAPAPAPAAGAPRLHETGIRAVDLFAPL